MVCKEKNERARVENDPLQDDVTDDKGSAIQEARVILYRLFVRDSLQEVVDGISNVFSFFRSDSVVVAEEE